MARIEMGEGWYGVRIRGGAGGVEFGSRGGTNGGGVSTCAGVSAAEVGGRVGVRGGAVSREGVFGAFVSIQFGPFDSIGCDF